MFFLFFKLFLPNFIFSISYLKNILTFFLKNLFIQYFFFKKKKNIISVLEEDFIIIRKYFSMFIILNFSYIILSSNIFFVFCSGSEDNCINAISSLGNVVHDNHDLFSSLSNDISINHDHNININRDHDMIPLSNYDININRDHDMIPLPNYDININHDHDMIPLPNYDDFNFDDLISIDSDKDNNIDSNKDNNINKINRDVFIQSDFKFIDTNNVDDSIYKDILPLEIYNEKQLMSEFKDKVDNLLKKHKFNDVYTLYKVLCRMRLYNNDNNIITTNNVFKMVSCAMKDSFLLNERKKAFLKYILFIQDKDDIIKKKNKKKRKFY